MKLDVAPTTASSSELPDRQVLGVPKEIVAGEQRVAVTPETAKILQQLGFKVWVETGAGEAANFSDQDYLAAGCQIQPPAILWATAKTILKVRPPALHPQLQEHEADLLTSGGTLVSFIYPAQHPDLLPKLAAQQATVVAMESVPRITRAQKMDALSSMANLAGYRAVIEAANHFGRFFSGQITAAGKIPPAKVLVIGAGVAGLAAIATAKSLGAIVRAFDTRLVVKEQVESLGAEFLELEFAEDGSGTGGYAKVMSQEFIDAEMALFAAQAQDVDIIITTALIPGHQAPVLITQAMVKQMRSGSVVVDMAAEQGGNCAVTRPGQVYNYQGVTILGLTDLVSRMAHQASQLYSTNLCHLLTEMRGAAVEDLDLDNDILQNDILRSAVILYHGQKVVLPPSPPVELPKPNQASQRVTVAETASPRPSGSKTDAATHSVTSSVSRAYFIPIRSLLWVMLISLTILGIGLWLPTSFLSHFTVFVLACLVGWQVIWNVKPALHTPLMSVTNAISGIILIGGMLQLAHPFNAAILSLGAVAVFVGMINVSGGFWVTQRMLRMFQ